MGLIINQSLINYDTAKELEALCPFSAITYENGKLEIKGGKVTNNTSGLYGGGLYIYYSEASISEGNISGIR